MNTADLHKARQKVLRRQKILEEAIAEYDQAVTEVISDATQRARSRPISSTQAASLLEISRSHLYRLGAQHCSTYHELWSWTKVNRPDLLQNLERNYERQILNS